MKRWVFVFTLVFCIAAFIHVRFALAAKYKIAFAHNEPPTMEAQYHVWFLIFQKYAEKYSHGEIELQEFPAAQMGTDTVAAKKLQMNAIQMQTCAANNLASLYGGFDLFTLPFLIKSLECGIIDVLGNKKLLEDISREAEAKANIRVLSWSAAGMRNMMNSKRPILKPADLKGLRMRVAKNPILLDLYKTLGGSPIGISSAETFTALQTKVVDGNDGGIGWAYANKFYEVQKYYSITNHQMVTVPMIINNKFYEGLPKNIQQAISQAAIISARQIDCWIISKSSEILKAFAQHGLKISYPDLAPFRKVVRPIWKKYAKRVGGMKRIEWVLRLQKNCF